MMEINDKKVILISGDRTKWYEQAIFIMNKDMQARALPADIVGEAEQIIDCYLTGRNYDPALQAQTCQRRHPLRTERRGRFGLFMYLLLTACCITLFCLVIKP